MSLTKLEKDVRNLLVNNAFQQIFEKDGKRGFDYLLNRGISEETIREWKLGYCPQFVRDIIFNDRIIVPYYDSYDRLVSVSARKVEGEKPFWWNESFEKKNYLFGLNKAKKHIFENNIAILVEGQFDVITMHQFGLKFVVGICGSSFDDNQFLLLSRYCNRIIIAYDRDSNQAGQEASKKTFEYLKDKNFYIYRWFFPVGCDPDQYIIKNGYDYCIKEIQEILKKYSFKDKRNFGQEYYYGEN